MVLYFTSIPLRSSLSQVVKMGLSVAVMIISWEKEAQWILCTQLLVSLLIHFSDGLSPYRLYIVLASHIVSSWNVLGMNEGKVKLFTQHEPPRDLHQLDAMGRINLPGLDLRLTSNVFSLLSIEKSKAR
jgi:hypothetical protein